MKGIITAVAASLALVFLLPSCEAIKDLNINGSVIYVDPDSGAKGGINFGGKDKDPSWWVRLPSFKSERKGFSVDIAPTEISPQK